MIHFTQLTLFINFDAENLYFYEKSMQYTLQMSIEYDRFFFTKS